LRSLAAVAMPFVLASFVILATVGSKADSGTGSRLAVGDELTYDITVELQQHHVSAGAKHKDISVETAARGSETFTIYAIGPDGTAYANARTDFQGNDAGTPFDSQTTSTAKIMPDGRLQMKDQPGLGVSEAVGFANTTTAEIMQHPLHPGSAWTSAADNSYVHLTLSRKVTGQKTYQGYTAYEVQSIGNGALLKTSDGLPVTGTIAISGTSYYDSADHLLLGEALRTLTVVEKADNGSAHDNYSATMNVVLSSWTHASPAPDTGSPSPQTPGESPSEPAAASPTPVPTIAGPTPVPTVTPRLGY
jgi:hypothetical protein